MSKYLGIVKEVSNGMLGTATKIITKTSSSRDEIKNWKDCYPNCQSIMIEYDENMAEDIEIFFEEFEDFSPKTEKEKQKARELYEELMRG